MTHPHRLVIIVPEARVPTFGTWYASNIDPLDNCTEWMRLNAAGDDAAPTHRWASTALTDAQMRLILLRVCQIASRTPPTAGQWSSWTRPQKVAWLDGTRDAMYAACGIWLDICDQGAAWRAPEAALTRTGTRRRQVAAASAELVRVQ